MWVGHSCPTAFDFGFVAACAFFKHSQHVLANSPQAGGLTSAWADDSGSQDQLQAAGSGAVLVAPLPVLRNSKVPSRLRRVRDDIAIEL